MNENVSKLFSVIVTFNRLECLKKALDAYDNSCVFPAGIVVVDNCSNDGTIEFLEKWKAKQTEYQKIVIVEDKNIGGAGGFHDGLRCAMENGANWVLVSDDDAYIDANCVHEISDKIAKISDESVAAICTSVICNGHDYDTSHRRRLGTGTWIIEGSEVPADEYKQDEFELDMFSYVGVCINAKAMERYGITNKEYFIYYDDTEHSLRIRKFGKIICVPAAKFFHEKKVGSRAVTWGSYYIVRNMLVTIKHHLGIVAYRKMIVQQYMRRCSILARITKKYTSGEVRLVRQAIHDAIKENMGLNSLYKPGWKESSK